MNEQQKNQAMIHCMYTASNLGFKQISQSNLPTIFSSVNHQGRSYLRDSLFIGMNIINLFGDACLTQGVINLWNFIYLIIFDGADEGSRASQECIKQSILLTHQKFPQDFFKIVFIGIDLKNDYIAKKELAELAIIPQVTISCIDVGQIYQALNEINYNTIHSDQYKNQHQENIILLSIEKSESMKFYWHFVSQALNQFLKNFSTQTLVCLNGFNETCQVLSLNYLSIQQQDNEQPLPNPQDQQIEQVQHMRKIIKIFLIIIVILIIIGLIIRLFFWQWFKDILNQM